jgi:hypothetical protein
VRGRTFLRQFSSVLRPELIAVEARRRRYRIEQTLGFLPRVPAPSTKRKTYTASPDGSQLDVKTLIQHQSETEEKREKLTATRRYPPPATPPKDTTPPSQAKLGGTSTPPAKPEETSTPSDPLANAAKNYLEAAKDWYTKARQYRDAQLQKFMSLDPPQGGQKSSEWENAQTSWEHAEAILRAAAQARSDAAREVHRETVDSEQDEGAQTLSGRTADGGTPEALEPVHEAFGQILLWEKEALRRLEADIHAEEERRQAAEVVRRGILNRFGRRGEGWREAAARPPSAQGESSEAGSSPVEEALYHLAGWEQTLFQRAVPALNDPGRKASCRAAEEAAEEELQRRGRAWNEVRALRRSLMTAPSPAGTGAPGGGGTSPPPAPSPPPPVPPAGGAALAPSYSPGGELLPDGPLALTRQEALGMDLVGLALSGGGIRSATFGLGVLQGLAQLRLLGTIDILSTVSGGGYIGSWLAAWVRREGSLPNVERQLSPNRVSQSTADRYDPVTQNPLGHPSRDEEPEPVHHLRAYSRYLSPRFGLFSADTWTLGTIYARNLFVNSLLFLPLALAVVLFWRLLLHGYTVPLGPWESVADWEHLATWRFGLTCLFGLAFVVATVRLAWEEENLFEADQTQRLRDEYAERPRFTHSLILLPLLVVALVGSWIFSIDPTANAGKSYGEATTLRYFGQDWRPALFNSWPVWPQFALAFGLISLTPSLVVRVIRFLWRVRVGADRYFNWRGLWGNIVLAIFFGATLALVLWKVIWPLSYYAAVGDPGSGSPAGLDKLCLLHAVGLPLVFGAMVLGGFAEMAVVGMLLNEYEREWRSRLSAYLLIGAAVWLVMATAVFLIPWGIEELGKGWTWIPFKGGITTAWAAISGGGAWLARLSASRGEGRRPSWWSRALMAIAPPVFLIGLLAGVSIFAQWVTGALEGAKLDPAPVIAAGRSEFLFGAASQPKAGLVLLVLSGVAVLAAGFTISVNRFSLHMLYANRLTRCYLGASARKRRGGSRGAPTGVRELPSKDHTRWPRQANYFTGFDPLDDFPLAELRTVGGDSPYTGPVPLINCALNCLSGDELAIQDRRADAFMMTADWCGGLLTGYARTPHTLPDANNLTLGRVMTISGAAVDPNMSGLSPPLTALMTLLNTRLGWWLDNPDPAHRARFRLRRGTWGASEPGLGLRLLWEFFGWTSEKDAYVHVSDGGHFENLGVYELVRRRCRFIIVADAGVDRVAASDNMAAMLRLIRTDFGVRIELDQARMQLGGVDGYSAWHCCVGRIRYDEVDDWAVPGVLVYLQASLTGDEPPDLLQYVSRHPSFPRQSTLNQFFDEAQFEAYRVLGHHIATEAFGEAAPAWTSQAPSASKHQEEAREVFSRLREQWMPPLECAPAEGAAAAQAALALERYFDSKAALNTLSNATYPEVATVAPPFPNPLPEFRAISQTLQVMELTWNAMRLGEFHAHPRNRGWMNTFRRWTASPAFHKYWPVLRAEYSRPFVSFCEDILNLQSTGATLQPLAIAAPLPASLDDQFEYEWADWADQVGLPAMVFPRKGFFQRLVGNKVAVLSPTNSQPLAWLICQRNYPSCGIVCVTRTRRQRAIEPVRHSPFDAEFCIWILGAYRSLGIGREAGDDALRKIDQMCAFPPPAGPDPVPVRRLVAYYPLREDTVGCRLGRERWMDFHFDLGFRRVRQPEHGWGAKFVVVERDVGGAIS